MKTEVVCGVTIPMGSPTVALWVEVPADGKWVPLACPAEAPAEYVYSAHELDRVMRSYGSVWAYTATRKLSAPGFRLVARGLFSGRVLATYTWAWSAAWGHYEPEAEPWNLWDELAAEACKVPVPYTLSGFSRLAAGLSTETYRQAA